MAWLVMKLAPEFAAFIMHCSGADPARNGPDFVNGQALLLQHRTWPLAGLPAALQPEGM